jgi:hypothetical protein
MSQEIELSFAWRRPALREPIIGITKAVWAGFDTKDKIFSSLPQFSEYRIALALDALITARMAENNFGVLSVHTDMDLVMHLSHSKFNLPMDKDSFKALQRLVIHRLGARNPAGVEVLLKAITKER